MTDLLIKKFVKNYDDISSAQVRKDYTFLSGIVGIVINVILSALKFIVGIFTNSVSVTADAVNNLSDASSSVVSIFGAKISSKPADEEHPYGHGRSEYISAFIVACIILIMGFELFTGSVSKIINPEPVAFGIGSLIALVVSIPLKLFLAYFNNKVAKKINSLTIKAVVTDSLYDCIATTGVIISLVVSGLTKYNTDGYIGIIVAVLILKAGFEVANEVFTALLGTAPDKDLVKNIEKTVLAHEGIVGIHDMMVHDYGPNNILCSLHAEVPAETNILISHDLIDNIEIEINQKFGVLTTIHLDPVETENETVTSAKLLVENAVKEINKDFTIHDFRMVSGNTHTNVLFDIVIPFGTAVTHSELMALVKQKIAEINPSYRVVAKIEHKFI